MSLPFLKVQKLASVMIAKRKQDGSTEPSHEEGQHPPERMSAAEDLLRAIAAKDASGVVSAIQNLITLCDEPESDEAD